MNVYVITSGEYSDYHICAVAQSRKKAEALKKLFDKENYTGASIEVYDTNTYQTGRSLYVAEYDVKRGELKITRVKESDEYPDIPSERTMKGIVGNGLYLRTGINARNKSQAEKIFYDRLAKYKAEQSGLT